MNSFTGNENDLRSAPVNKMEDKRKHSVCGQFWSYLKKWTNIDCLEFNNEFGDDNVIDEWKVTSKM